MKLIFPMHYKIASFILNASKHQTGSREVYIAQPDSQKEGLAGKIFLMAEIGGKKSEAKAAIDFILDSINRFYYEDEKIFLQDKVEGLTLENIFEAAVAKINKALLEFLNAEKIFLQPEESSVILGLVFENKLYFSNFGNNKALLIYQQDEAYELINVEASATEEVVSDIDNKSINPKFFSSVISGNVPPSSYFLFCNDVLVEYLSNKELVNIITKLPPMVAAEQIKTTLAKLNSYVPFLGIIIKNTFGLSLVELKEDVQVEAQKSAHNSITHLNNTETRTEEMLAPTGIFNLKKLANIYRKIANSWQNILREKLKKTSPDQALPVKSLPDNKSKISTNLIKEKIFFGRSHSKLSRFFKIFGHTIINIFNPKYWLSLFQSIKQWLAQLNRKNRGIFMVLILIALILISSLLLTRSKNRKESQDQVFNEAIVSIETRKDQLEPYLLYNNYDGAKALIGDLLLSLDELNYRNKEQEQRINDLRAEIITSKTKVQKLTTINEPQQIYNYKDYNASAETRNLLVMNDKIYAADPLAKAVYIWDKQENKADSILLSGDISGLEHPVINNDKIVYLNDKSLITIDPNTGSQNNINLEGFGTDDKLDAFAFYGTNLYALSASNNQIYKLSKSANTYSNRSNWLKGEASLSNAVGMAVTGSIFILKNDGTVDEFYGNNIRLDQFSLEKIDPSLDSASLLKYFNNKLYILDRASKRLIVFEIDGKLKQQYKFPSLNNIKDFTVSADDFKAYILNDDSIYQIDL